MQKRLPRPRSGESRGPFAGSPWGLCAASAARTSYPSFRSTGDVHRGIEVNIGLREGLPNEAFVAEALGNLAVFSLARERGERLDWQVLRVDVGGRHHYRLVVRHPDRVLDLGLVHELGRILHRLSDEDVEQLRERFSDAQKNGLKPVPLRHVRESVDFWRDDFWNWLG